MIIGRLTPAMAVGMSKRLWEISDIVKVLESWEEKDHDKTVR